MNDEQKLIKNLIKGDSFAFDELYKQYYNQIYSFSFRYLQNKQDAEGVVQEVFIKVWNSQDKLKEINNMNAWLFTITFNQIKMIFRNMAIERRKMETVAISSIFEDHSAISEIEFNDLMEKAEDIIERLPSRQKSVIKLSIKEGLTSIEISKQLGINKRTVENHLSSARAFLKKVFKEENLIPLVIYWLLL
ncbi:MAG: RNA polymerase sigma-70 factor [Bacteroidales bacterium]|nr:RNA polymerase sigma-70 factor [Bacteroidales bacterium]